MCIRDRASAERSSIWANKLAHAVDYLQQRKARWEQILANFDAPAADHADLLDATALAAQRPQDRVIDLLLRRDLRISYRTEVVRPLQDIFVGRELEPLLQSLEGIHRRIRSGRLFVAMHMHAGDGNVHTNIPVSYTHLDVYKRQVLSTCVPTVFFNAAPRYTTHLCTRAFIPS